MSGLGVIYGRGSVGCGSAVGQSGAQSRTLRAFRVDGGRYCQIFFVENYIIDKIIFKAIISLSFRVLLLKLIFRSKGSVIVLYD